MEMPYYNLKYSYWKRCSIYRHHITAQTFCIPLIGPIPGLVVTGAGPPHLPPPPFAIWYIISSVQEINHLWKFTSGFIGPQILNFARGLSLSPGPQSSLIPPCKISFGGPAVQRRLWLSLWGPSETHGALHGSQGPRPFYRLNPPLIVPVTPTSSTSHLFSFYIYIYSCIVHFLCNLSWIYLSVNIKMNKMTHQNIHRV
jgi:hypothetical protein